MMGPPDLVTHPVWFGLGGRLLLRFQRPCWAPAGYWVEHHPEVMGIWQGNPCERGSCACHLFGPHHASWIYACRQGCVVFCRRGPCPHGVCQVSFPLLWEALRSFWTCLQTWHCRRLAAGPSEDHAQARQAYRTGQCVVVWAQMRGAQAALQLREEQQEGTGEERLRACDQQHHGAS